MTTRRATAVAPGLIAAALLLVLAIAARAAPPAWHVDHDDSRLGFTATQMGSEFDGRFREFEADIRFSPENLADSRIDVVIRIASIDTRNAERDRGVQQAAWFDVANHPTARFTVEDIEHAPDGYRAVAALTMKGVTRRVELPFDVSFSGSPGARTAHATGRLTVDRRDFKIGEGEWADTSAVGAEVTISFDLRAREAP